MTDIYAQLGISPDGITALDAPKAAEVTHSVSTCLFRNEAGDADMLISQVDGKLIYDFTAESWFIWDGVHWQQDLTRQAERIVRSLSEVYDAEASKQESAEASKPYRHRAFLLRTKSRPERVLHIAASSLGITADSWNNDPYILGVGNGLVDLRTGDFRPATPADMIRVHSPIEWTGLETPCPVWIETLKGIFNDDLPLISYLWRNLGYSISGLTSENILNILVGNGQNGKSTIASVLYHVLGGGYFVSCMADELMQSDNEHGKGEANAFLYGLRDKRVLFAKESRQGDRLDAGLVKSLTGSDTVTARTLFQKQFTEFEPTHKVFLMTNEPPHISGDDHALWLRVKPVDFPNSYVEKPTLPNERRKDGTLLDKLKAESSGILAWLVRGFLEYQKHGGLVEPACVTQATAAYRQDEDTFGQFLDEYITYDPAQATETELVYCKYLNFSTDIGESKPMSKPALTRKLVKRFGKEIVKPGDGHGKGKAYRVILK